jgi:CRISPR system Cascade subunit CasE
VKTLDSESLHQEAWRLQHEGESVDRRDFLFAPAPNGKLIFRSQDEELPILQMELRCLLAPVRRIGQKERFVKPREFPSWLSDLLSRNGFALEKLLMVKPMRMKVRGDRLIPVIDTAFRVRIVDKELANRAYRQGIGRYKAFGCGMLRRVV